MSKQQKNILDAIEAIRAELNALESILVPPKPVGKLTRIDWDSMVKVEEVESKK